MTHYCFADRCETQLAAHRLMCYPHWRRVPQEMGAELRNLWRRWDKLTTADLERFSMLLAAAQRCADA